MKGPKRGKPNRAVQAMSRQLKLVEAGVVKVPCPADPPPYSIRPWYYLTMTLNSGSWSMDKISKVLAESIGLVETGATFDAWDLFDIRLVNLMVFGDTNPAGTDQNVTLEVNETRVVNGAAAGTPFTRTALECIDRSARNHRARLGCKFRLPSFNGNNTATIFTFDGALAQLTVQWRLTSNLWLITP